MSQQFDPTLESGQPTSAIKYMTVPEKIELTTGHETSHGGGRDPPNRYRPMRVPDKITLESAAPPAMSESGRGGQARQGVASNKVVMDARKLAGEQEYIRRGPQHVVEPRTSAPVQQQPPLHVPTDIADLERRVTSLEQKVQRVTEAVVRRDNTHSNSRQGSRFWYVMTLAGWMMVPLIVAFMYHYKKTQ